MAIYRGPCRDFLDEFSSFVDGTLEPRQRSLLLAHLDCCEACLRHLKAYREGVAAYRDANAPVPAWGLYERVVERLGGDRASERTGGAPVGALDSDSSGRRVGAVLVMAALAVLVLVSPAGLDLDLGTVAELSTTPDDDAAPATWASVIPMTLPVMDPAQARRAVMTPSPGFDAYGGEVVLPVDGLVEVPRRQVRVLRVSDFGLSRGDGFTGWSPRRRPVTIHRATTLAPATWVAEAALRIP